MMDLYDQLFGNQNSDRWDEVSPDVNSESDFPEDDFPDEFLDDEFPED